MIGSPALILGFCRYDDDDEFWQRFQLFTAEDMMRLPDIDRKFIEARKKYHGDTVHFTSIDKVVNIKQEVHDFDLRHAEPVELTKAEWLALIEELNADGWEDFDIETWGK